MFFTLSILLIISLSMLLLHLSTHQQMKTRLAPKNVVHARTATLRTTWWSLFYTHGWLLVILLEVVDIKVDEPTVVMVIAASFTRCCSGVTTKIS